MNLLEEIKRLRELAAKATPAPWVNTPFMFVHSEDGCLKLDCGTSWDRSRSPDANPEFIAASRTAIPTLCDAMEKSISTFHLVLERYGHNPKIIEPEEIFSVRALLKEWGIE